MQFFPNASTDFLSYIPARRYTLFINRDIKKRLVNGYRFNEIGVVAKDLMNLRGNLGIMVMIAFYDDKLRTQPFGGGCSHRRMNPIATSFVACRS